MIPPCKICGLENPPNNHFYSIHKLSQEKYYKKYYNKLDLFTKEAIKFTSAENYLFSDFQNRTNFKNYLKTLSEENKKDFCLEIIKKRKNFKNLIFTPCEVELKSLICPPVSYLSALFDGLEEYYNQCEKMGLKNRFSCPDPIAEEAGDLDKNAKTIAIDTREQKALKFDNNYKTVIETLPYGDYTSKLNNNFVYIERKSLQDFIGTLSSGLERFQKEIERAAIDNKYLIVLIEYNLNKALNFHYSKYIKKFTKCTPDFIFSNMRNLIQTYSNLQFLFVDSREESARVVPKILSNQKYFSGIDLQLMYNLKNL